MPAFEIAATTPKGSVHMYPGQSSVLRTAHGGLTLQTELIGAPPEVVTFVDFRGRLLERFVTPLPPDPLDSAKIALFAERAHLRLEILVREMLTRSRSKLSRLARGAH